MAYEGELLLEDGWVLTLPDPPQDRTGFADLIWLSEQKGPGCPYMFPIKGRVHLFKFFPNNDIKGKGQRKR